MNTQKNGGFRDVLNENNKYDITPYYLVHLLSHHLVQTQLYNKILMETTLPNIGNRWMELKLPIHNDRETRKRISDKIQSVFEQKWNAQKSIIKLQQELGNLTT